MKAIEMTVKHYVSLLKAAGVQDLDNLQCVYIHGGPLITDDELMIFYSKEQGEFFTDHLEEIKKGLSE